MRTPLAPLLATAILFAVVPTSRAQGDYRPLSTCDWDALVGWLHDTTNRQDRSRPLLRGKDADSMIGWTSEARPIGVIEYIMPTADPNTSQFVWTIARAVWNESQEDYSDVTWYAGQLSVGLLKVNEMAFVIEDTLYLRANTRFGSLHFSPVNRRIANTEAYYGVHPQIDPDYLIGSNQIPRIACLGTFSRDEDVPITENLRVKVTEIHTVEDGQHTVTLTLFNESEFVVAMRLNPPTDVSSQLAKTQECLYDVLEPGEPLVVEYASPPTSQPRTYGIVVSDESGEPILATYLRVSD